MSREERRKAKGSRRARPQIERDGIEYTTGFCSNRDHIHVAVSCADGTVTDIKLCPAEARELATKLLAFAAERDPEEIHVHLSYGPHHANDTDRSVS